MQEQVPHEIIGSVPGMSSTEQTQQAVFAGQRTPIKNFRGNPANVLGHPDNAASKMADAYGRKLANTRNEGWSATTVIDTTNEAEASAATPTAQVIGETAVTGVMPKIEDVPTPDQINGTDRH